VRGDFFTVAITDKLGGPNGGTASSFLASPKLQMIFEPWFNTEFYLNGGFGFHSNDARGTKIDIFNLLNVRADDIAYYYASRLKNEPPGPDGGGYNDVEFHPAEPRSIRVTVTARF
jgi:hypothetical protein